MAELEVDIVDTDGKVWSGPARRVVAPAGDGEMGILAGHVPVLSVLRPGEVRVLPTDSQEVLRFTVAGGFFSVDSDQVTIVADEARPAAVATH
ncbi:F0F1 ATP synthase subunit epsilon [Cellulomonas citrea]|uniref:F0F1 ATP synthase subunit epsilon n=1 Tax=Cellulomonas citrea TaxID=1909423 RepID=UPI00135AEDD0|nr:F0F1 ATP synthase subunit epsilon [Cellulomonas citrea]